MGRKFWLLTSLSTIVASTAATISFAYSNTKEVNGFKNIQLVREYLNSFSNKEFVKTIKDQKLAKYLNYLSEKDSLDLYNITTDGEYYSIKIPLSFIDKEKEVIKKVKIWHGNHFHIAYRKTSSNELDQDKFILRIKVVDNKPDFSNVGYLNQYIHDENKVVENYINSDLSKTTNINSNQFNTDINEYGEWTLNPRLIYDLILNNNNLYDSNPAFAPELDPDLNKYKVSFIDSTINMNTILTKLSQTNPDYQFVFKNMKPIILNKYSPIGTQFLKYLWENIDSYNFSKKYYGNKNIYNDWKYNFINRSGPYTDSGLSFALDFIDKSTSIKGTSENIGAIYKSRMSLQEDQLNWWLTARPHSHSALYDTDIEKLSRASQSFGSKFEFFADNKWSLATMSVELEQAKKGMPKYNPNKIIDMDVYQSIKYIPWNSPKDKKVYFRDEIGLISALWSSGNFINDLSTINNPRYPDYRVLDLMDNDYKFPQPGTNGEIVSNNIETEMIPSEGIQSIQFNNAVKYNKDNYIWTKDNFIFSNKNDLDKINREVK